VEVLKLKGKDFMDFSSLVIIGAAVSLLTQLLKTRFGTTSWKTLSIVIGLSLLGGIGYYFGSGSEGFASASVKILTVAGAIYAYIISKYDH